MHADLPTCPQHSPREKEREGDTHACIRCVREQGGREAKARGAGRGGAGKSRRGSPGLGRGARGSAPGSGRGPTGGAGFHSIPEPRIPFEISQDFPRIYFPLHLPPCIYTAARRAQFQPNQRIHPSIHLRPSLPYYYYCCCFFSGEEGEEDRLSLTESIDGRGCSHPGSGYDPAARHGGLVAEARRRRRPQGGAGDDRRRRGRRPGPGPGGAARARRRRQRRRPRRHRQDPPQLQVQSYHRGLCDPGSGAAGAGAHHGREHDHHRLLDARHDGVRAAQARQGVVGAPGDPRRHHVVGERAQPHHPLPRGRRRGLPPQARPPLRRLPPLQPHPVIINHRVAHPRRRINSK